MERAKTLLVEAELSIGQIAQTCHFSSQASFTRAFTRAAGVSPARYRMAKGAVN
jgi:AraC family transcriptional regulator